MARKYPNMSIIKIKETMSTKDWNNFLAICYTKRDIEGLKRALYGIQADMSDLAGIGLTDAAITSVFLRLQRSIEQTAKKIFRELYPSPLDTGKGDLSIKARLLIKAGGHNGKQLSQIEQAKLDFKKSQIAKRRRDAEFEKFIKDSSF
jgi:hypothetical protein